MRLCCGFLLLKILCIYLTEREHKQGEWQGEHKAGSQDPRIMTWAEGRCLTYWVTQAPLNYVTLKKQLYLSGPPYSHLKSEMAAGRKGEPAQMVLQAPSSWLNTGGSQGLEKQSDLPTDNKELVVRPNEELSLFFFHAQCCSPDFQRNGVLFLGGPRALLYLFWKFP